MRLAGERVLFLVNALESDAPTRLAAATASAAANAGMNCRFVALSRSGDLAPSIDPQLQPGTVGMRGMWDIAGLHSLFRLMRDFRPKIVSVCLARPTIIGGWIAAIAGVPHIVITQHGWHEWAEGGRLTALLGPSCFRLLSRRAAAIVTVSESARKDILHAGIAPSKLLTIPNGVDTIRFSPDARRCRGLILEDLFGHHCPSDVKLIGAAGGLKEIKGHATLVEAASLLASGFPEARFVIWGEGPMRERLQSAIIAAGLCARFVLPGTCSDMPDALASCDIVVQPSLGESFGLAAVEAMSCGVAVVASAAGGLPEIISPGVNGCLFPAGDAEALAAELQYLLQNPSERYSMAAMARRDVCNRFALGRMTGDYLRLYDDLISGGVG